MAYNQANVTRPLDSRLIIYVGTEIKDSEVMSFYFVFRSYIYLFIGILPDSGHELSLVSWARSLKIFRPHEMQDAACIILDRSISVFAILNRLNRDSSMGSLTRSLVVSNILWKSMWLHEKRRCNHYHYIPA